MPSSYRFLAHKIFQKYAHEFERRNPRAVRSFRKQCEKAATNPFTAGKWVRIPNPELQNKIYRTWIGGPKGFRFIYFVDRDQCVVCGVFVSSVPRSRFDYKDIPWEEDAIEIFSSLVAGRQDDFEEWTF